ncbi:hypothetical protein LguiA_006599 [Lonicera macranthoides]
MGVFKIGTILEMIAWTVAVLVMVINGYLLLDFVFSEVNGLVFAFVVFTGIALYVIFVLYLISHGGCLPSTWFSQIHSKESNSCGGN